MPAALLAVASATAWAGPWVQPGDLALRHDLQLLADAQIIHAPLMSWPLPWASFLEDLQNVELDGYAPIVRHAAERVTARAAAETAAGGVRGSAWLALAEKPRLLRTFEDTPREDAEAGAALEWSGLHLAVRLQATAVEDPTDGKEFRPDGSYVGVAFGNWMMSVGYLERWWGPGYEGSLILSNNARPTPGLALERRRSTPPEARWLRWIGPWSLAALWGELESNRAVPEPRLFAMRFGFRPVQDLEIAFSRSAQWCGEGRPCDFDAFVDMLGASRDIDDISGVDVANHLGGYDVRWASPIGTAPYALYAQAIGEDSADWFPNKFLGLFGVEGWGSWGERSWRLHLEWANTACSFADSEPTFNCAYNNFAYPTGYRYRGRSIGHSLDNDSRVTSLGASLIQRRGNSWHLLVRDGDLNRDGAPDPRNTVTPAKQSLFNAELSHTRSARYGTFDLGVGFDRLEDVGGATTDDTRAFVRWRWNHEPE